MARHRSKTPGKAASPAPSSKRARPARPKPAAKRDQADKSGKPGKPGKSFPIVGIGTSAGGLQALEQFLRKAPKDGGMAYVVVQHLDPTHKGMLPELLGRFTEMPVKEVLKREQVKRNCVYVIPPNKDLSIDDGNLVVLDPDSPRGLRLPIDHFFRALADDCGELAVGVILSGMGSDGTLGLSAIREKAGLILVQDPADAEFDGMPRSAIGAGLADIIAPARDLPARLIAYFGRLRLVPVPALRIEEQSRNDMDRILALLRVRSGRDFSGYKKSSVYRRIDRRRNIHQLDKVDDYVRYVREHPQELDFLFKELLIGVTSFFRDPASWDFIKARVIPAALKQYPGGAALRAWVPACSTGEEAYSLAMAFQEVLEEAKPQGRYSLQIFATDLDRDAVEKARKAEFSTNIQADLGAKRLGRFFEEDGARYRVRSEIREMVTFAPHDVLTDPPFTKLDFLFCRNLLIYLGAELQKRLISLFHYSLSPGGVLFLGTAETIGGFGEGFVPLDPKFRLYHKSDMAADRLMPRSFLAGGLPIIAAENDDETARVTPPSLQALADQLLLQQFCPAAVLVTEQGDIIYINGRTGRYLEPATGKANWNIHAMAREGLRGELATAMHQASSQKQTVQMRGISVAGDDGSHTVDISVRALDEPARMRGMLMIVFADSAVAAGPRGKHRPSRKLEQMSLALRQAQHNARKIFEDMQTTQEELKSANEELQSMNEELTTSKEEMQSMNEELQTVNAELVSKVDELTRNSNDMKNLLDSTDIATVFLDNALCIRRFTSHVTEIFKLLPGDVNRPLSDIVTQLEYPQLEQDAQEVLRSLVFSEREVAASNGRWFKVRIMPYRTLSNMIDGVVITFSNISKHKILEAKLRKRSGEA